MTSTIFLKNEIKKNLRFTVIWGLIWGFYGFINFAFFNLIKNQGYASVRVIPKELQEGLGIDPVFSQTIEGFINGNFMTLMLILNAVFAVLLINNLLNSRVQNKEIFFYLSKKFKRGSIVLYSFIASEILLFIATSLIVIITYLGAEILTDEIVPKRYFFLIAIGLFIYSSLFTALGVLIGRIMSATQTMLATLGVTIAITVYNILSRITGAPEFMKYFSPLYYFDTTTIAKEKFLDIQKMFPIIVITVILVLMGWYIFKKRDIEI